MSVTITATFATMDEAVKFLSRAPAADVKIADSPKSTADTTAGKTKDKPVAASTGAPAPSPAPAPSADAQPAKGGDKVDYPTLQKAVFKLAAFVKENALDADEHVLSIAKKHGGDTFKALKPEAWGAALKDVEVKFADLSAAKTNEVA